jgi:hypothetical protein
MNMELDRLKLLVSNLSGDTKMTKIILVIDAKFAKIYDAEF